MRVLGIEKEVCVEFAPKQILVAKKFTINGSNIAFGSFHYELLNNGEKRLLQVHANS